MSQSEERGLTVLQSHAISRELSTRVLIINLPNHGV